MKALITTSIFSLFLISTAAIACYPPLARVLSVPTATCATYAGNVPIPQYVCCKKSASKAEKGWSDTWVSGGCDTVEGASFDFGCNTDSPVLTTGAPILASCQFSYSTNTYPYSY